MRRGQRFTLCLLLLLWCNCTVIMDCLAAEGGPAETKVASDTSTDESSDAEEGSPTGAFPFKEFEAMFNSLASQMGLHSENEEPDLRRALEALFSSIPQPSSPRVKPTPQLQKGLLQKMLAAKMERQQAGHPFNFHDFFKEFTTAMKQLQDFKPDNNASPAEALQQLAHLTKSWVAPDGAEGLHKYMNQAAQVLREFLPGLTSSEEL